MNIKNKRENIRQFVNRWIGRGKEDEDGRSYWIDLLTNVIGIENATEHINFEKKVVVDGHTKRIDAYVPETSVIIEQKSFGIRLDQKIHNSGDIDLTAYEQAKRYNDHLPYDERARWIVTCNFDEIWIYDMNLRIPEPRKIKLDELLDKAEILDFIIKKEVKTISNEMEVSIKAGEIVGLLYDAFLEQYRIPSIKEKDETYEQKEKREHKLKSLNALCVRLVFCLYAEDAGIFGKRNIFHDYLEAYDIKDCRKALIELFKILDTPYSERDDYLEEDLAQFPYVNGGLFADETIEIPPFTEEIKELILRKASENFNWRDISPTIFGAVFESTLNPDTRRSGGMHYTSIENIHKVIDPLFLDELKEELEEIKNRPTVGGSRTKGLQSFQDKLSKLKFFDPACGSGNFLTESFISIRRLENDVILELDKERIEGQLSFSFVKDSDLNVKVSIQQFYGIEINDFAVSTSKTALWIAEAQMLSETKSFADIGDDFLPLKTYTNIVEGNALNIDWENVVSKSELSYIIGNPPFIGARLMTNEQKKDLNDIFSGWKNIGNLDYVSCWYKKATDFIIDSKIRCALVSTNSITQGEQVSILWKPLFNQGIHFDFVYRTFRWDSEASSKAHVHCVIIGFSSALNNKVKKIFDTENITFANNINGYLIDAPNIFIENRKKSICNVSPMLNGSMPNDGGILSDFTTERKNEIIQKYPIAEKMFKPFLGATEFINNKSRWCLWLKDISPSDIKRVPPVLEAIAKVKEMRGESTRIATKKLADTPSLFGEIRQPSSNYIIIPRHSSQIRRYVPMGFMSPDIICGDANMIIPNASLFEFGILTSNVHNAWIRVVAGRIKSDFRYSANIVYNNFPWCPVTESQKIRIEQTAQNILDARSLYSECSLASLYDPLTMPQKLRKAHVLNDKAVMDAYGFSTKMTEEECVGELMKMYQELL